MPLRYSLRPKGINIIGQARKLVKFNKEYLDLEYSVRFISLLTGLISEATLLVVRIIRITLSRTGGTKVIYVQRDCENVHTFFRG